MTNAEMISQAIEDMNRERENAAKSKIRNLIAAIMGEQKVIREAQERLAEHKTNLAAVTIEPVNAADIVA